MSSRAPRRAAIILAVAAVSSTVLALAAAACVLPPLSSQAATVQGEGEVASEDRTTTAFSHVSVDAGMHVTIRTGAPEASVTLSAQQNLLPLITTDVKGDQLVVEVAPPGISSTKPITLTIHVPELASVTLSAGASGTLELVGGTLAVDVSAGATVKAIGELDVLKLTASSGASAKLGEVTTGSASVNLTGGSSAEIHVTGAVTGTADAGSTLVLTEKPASVDVKTSGGASVQGG